VEELLELKEYILRHDYDAALALVEELEEMSKKEIINNIRSYAVILLLHLIKQELEERTTKSWDISIANAVLEIQSLNRRRKAKGNYLDPEELQEVLKDAWPQAVNLASKEALEGLLNASTINERVSEVEIVSQAIKKIGP
jgi:ribosomal protein S17E